MDNQRKEMAPPAVLEASKDIKVETNVSDIVDTSPVRIEGDTSGNSYAAEIDTANTKYKSLLDDSTTTLSKISLLSSKGQTDDLPSSSKTINRSLFEAAIPLTENKDMAIDEITQGAFKKRRISDATNDADPSYYDAIIMPNAATVAASLPENPFTSVVMAELLKKRLDREKELNLMMERRNLKISRFEFKHPDHSAPFEFLCSEYMGEPTSDADRSSEYRNRVKTVTFNLQSNNPSRGRQNNKKENRWGAGKPQEKSTDDDVAGPSRGKTKEASEKGKSSKCVSAQAADGKMDKSKRRIKENYNRDSSADRSSPEEELERKIKKFKNRGAMMELFGSSDSEFSSADECDKNSSESPTPPVSPGRKNIGMMMKYLKVAGLNKPEYTMLWENYPTNSGKVHAILDLLTEKGLCGEPTVEKCKELKKQRKIQQEKARAALQRPVDGEDDATADLKITGNVVSSDSDSDK